MRVSETTDRLLREAEDVRGQAAHYEEQGNIEIAARLLQVEYGLHLIAHVFAAVHPEEYEDEEDDR